MYTLYYLKEKIMTENERMKPVRTVISMTAAERDQIMKDE